MMIFEDYTSTLLWMAIIIATVIVQAIIASRGKAMEKGAIPGKEPRDCSHENFVFRSWRTHQNSLENLSPMLGTIVLAILAGVDSSWTMWCAAIFAVARIIHMVLYYAIATEKNPSPRSYFFLIAFIANVVLLIKTIISLV